jgi:hypothetical protein
MRPPHRKGGAAPKGWSGLSAGRPAPWSRCSSPRALWTTPRHASGASGGSTAAFTCRASRSGTGSVAATQQPCWPRMLPTPQRSSSVSRRNKNNGHNTVRTTVHSLHLAPNSKTTSTTAARSSGPTRLNRQQTRTQPLWLGACRQREDQPQWLKSHSHPKSTSRTPIQPLL